MTFMLLTEHHLEFLSLTGGCTGSSAPTLLKMPHCWKSYVAARIMLLVGKVLKKVHKHVHLRFWYLLHMRTAKAQT